MIIPEGDFSVEMSPQGERQLVNALADPVEIRLMADADGVLSRIVLNGEDIGNFDLLRQRMLAISLGNPDPEVLLIPDNALRYEYWIQAMTAVRGERREGQIHKICDRIKFARQE